MIDAVPEKAESVMNAELLQLASMHGPKVRDLQSLYGFRPPRMKRNAEYKKIIGAPPAGRAEQSDPLERAPRGFQEAQGH